MQNNKVYRDEYYVRAVCRDPRFEDFYKEKESARIWHTSGIGFIGGVHISFDGEKIYNLFEDYPYNMTEEEIRILQEEEPFWADFFAWRLKEDN